MRINDIAVDKCGEYSLKVIFSGGSTGGHLMSGLSLAEEIKAIYPESDIMFFATSKPFEKECIQEKGFLFKKLPFTKGNKRSIVGKVRFWVGMVLDIVYTGFIIRKTRPDIVVGLGGYSSVPSIVGAMLLSIPFVLIEQNIVPGKVNRLFSGRAKEVFCHFQQSVKWFKKAKSVVVTGNPVRKDILSAQKEVSATVLGLSPEKDTILIIGGSQGASTINKVMADCLPLFEKRSDKLQIIHCTGDSDFDEIRTAYDRYRIGSYVCPFLSGMQHAYCMADVVVSRAGAGTITEITAVGLPSILIPYPFAADNHQYYNALELSTHGAAYLVEENEFDDKKAGELITGLLDDECKRINMCSNSLELGKPEAAGKIVKRINLLLIETG